MNRYAYPNLWYWLAILSLFPFVYLSTLQWGYDRYTTVDTYYSHGFLIPFITGFLIWKKRGTLKETPLSYSRFGLVLIVFALLLHFVSAIFYVFFTSGLSILVLVFGLSLFLFGRQRTKTVLFPLSFLIFMIPIPSSAINVISLPLKMWVANLGSTLVGILGIPIHQSGFYIDTAKGVLLVDDPCSGIRSLISFMALGALAGYISDSSMKSRSLLFALSIPIAMVTNILRVSFLIIISNYYGSGAAQPDTWAHDLSGYAAFFMGALLLFESKRLLEWEK